MLHQLLTEKMALCVFCIHTGDSSQKQTEFHKHMLDNDQWQSISSQFPLQNPPVKSLQRAAANTSLTKSTYNEMFPYWTMPANVRVGCLMSPIMSLKELPRAQVIGLQKRQRSAVHCGYRQQQKQLRSMYIDFNLLKVLPPWPEKGEREEIILKGIENKAHITGSMPIFSLERWHHPTIILMSFKLAESL